MKKRALCISLTAVLLLTGSTTVFAGGHGRSQRPVENRRANACRFVDEDGDGICDNQALRPGKGNGSGCVDENGDGICDYHSAGGKGCQYIDADGDGVCDNQALRPGKGNGGRGGRGGGRGRR